jgi:RNA dependent RNA polymerase
MAKCSNSWRILPAVSIKAATAPALYLMDRILKLRLPHKELKKCSLWMVSSMEPSYQLRSNLGDFACCGTVSKWAARLGQCLSTTVEYTITDRLMGKPAVVPDVISRLGMEHSDGTGIISRPLFERVCTRIPFALGPKDMSVMQIRFGGAKGTLSAWDVSESLLQKEVRNCKHDIILRGSMTKFQSEYDRIEVCAVGTSVVSACYPLPF